jgi:hypothetical protein
MLGNFVVREFRSDHGVSKICGRHLIKCLAAFSRNSPVQNVTEIASFVGEAILERGCAAVKDRR